MANKQRQLLSVSEVKEITLNGEVISALAIKPSDTVSGYLLYINTADQEITLATFFNEPRLFKRADALLKEANKLGLQSVTFDTTS